LSQSPVLAPRQKSWSSLATSAAVHAAVIALAVMLSNREPPVEETEPERRAEPSRQVDMIYLPPPPPRPPPPPPAPPPPPPEPPRPTPEPRAPPPRERQPEPEDRANAPPEATRSEGDETDEPEGASDTDAPREAPREAPRAEAPTMESEALRIFGRRRIATQPGVGPRATRPMESYIPDRPDKCVPAPAAAADSAGAVQYGMVVGKIYRQDGNRPLAGAHLQMLGTPYVAFTDSEGEYQFRFDLSLMDNCRTQYVRVTAQGYESRLLVLVVGQNVRSEDVHLQKRSGWPGL
jgi:outer membrane biosynthesis protein TonB